MNKLFLIVIVILILSVSPFILYLNRPTNEAIYLASFSYQREPQKPEKMTVKLYLVGDIMLNRGVEYMVEKKGGADFRFPFLKIDQDLREADILFGNLEGPISSKGTKIGSIYSFRAKPEAVNGLTFAGFDILSLANNHLFDYGRTALEETLKTLKENNIDYVGAGFNKEEAFSLKVKKIKDVRVGFLAYTNLGPKSWQATANTPGIAWFDQKEIEQIKKDIQIAKEKVDILIVSLHWGEEYSPEPSPFQIAFAKNAIDSGADLIVGHHPHVVQKIEKYQKGVIAYSLGNFVFDQKFSPQTMESLLLEVIIEGKKIKQVIPHQVKINDFFQPELKKNTKSFLIKVGALKPSPLFF